MQTALLMKYRQDDDVIYEGKVGFLVKKELEQIFFKSYDLSGCHKYRK